MVQILMINDELLSWSNGVLDRVNISYSPNFHLDEIGGLLNNSRQLKSITIGELLEIYFKYITCVPIDHSRYKISLGIQLEDRKTPRAIRNLEMIQNRLVTKFYTPPFFQISLRSLSMVTDCDEVYRIPVKVQKIPNFKLNILVLFEARIRATDLEDGENLFTRKLVVEPIIDQTLSLRG